MQFCSPSLCKALHSEGEQNCMTLKTKLELNVKETETLSMFKRLTRTTAGGKCVTPLQFCSQLNMNMKKTPPLDYESCINICSLDSVPG